jgi:hypothetical protein
VQVPARVGTYVDFGALDALQEIRWKAAFRVPTLDRG